jgi:hypothetical protein
MHRYDPSPLSFALALILLTVSCLAIALYSSPCLPVELGAAGGKARVGIAPALPPTPAPDALDFVAETQEGTIPGFSYPSDALDDAVGHAQALADFRREAIALTQQGKLVVLLNPRKGR